MNHPKDILYPDLLKKTLCFALYKDPTIPVDVAWANRGFLKKKLANPLAAFFRLLGMRLCVPSSYSQEQIEKGLIWPVHAHSMIGLRRMDNLQFCVETVLRENIPGDLIETGVWRGGSCILMRGILAAHEIKDRRVFVADSFEGLPKPNATEYPADSGDRHHEFSILAVSQKQVEENFRTYGLLDSQVVFLKGWFKDTLPSVPSKNFAVIRLDGDMYESTIDALNHLYPKLSRGGFCIIDDYCLPNCRKAVADYREAHGITAPILDIDQTGAFWRK